MDGVVSTSARIVLVTTKGISVTDPPIANAALRCLVDGGGKKAVNCEFLHTIAVAEFAKLFETIKCKHS